MEEKSKFCNCLYFSANALARNLTRMAEEQFLSTGLAPSYAFSLMVINEQPGVAPKEVARQLHMKPSTITRFLDKLVQKGLIYKEQAGKSISLYPTDEGLGMQENLASNWKKLHGSYSEVLGVQAANGMAKVIYDANQLLDE